MMLSRACVLSLALVGCNIENGVGNSFPPEPTPNPPDLANPTQTDVIVQTTTPKVDVLWVIAQTNVGIADDSLQNCEGDRMEHQCGTVGPYRNSSK